jgi:hypothetical protein
VVVLHHKGHAFLRGIHEKFARNSEAKTQKEKGVKISVTLSRGGESETLKGGQELTSHDSRANPAIELEQSTRRGQQFTTR